MSKPKPEPITFEEFQRLCEEAGIDAPDSEVMHADYQHGRALADVVEELTDHLEVASGRGGFTRVLLSINELEDVVAGRDVAATRKAAVVCAARLIRYITECNDDPGQN